MRPTNKYIHQQYTDRAFRDMETVDKNTRVKQLKEQGHSCLSCQHFPVSAKGTRVHHGMLKCPKSKNFVKHYNICHQHKEVQP